MVNRISKRRGGVKRQVGGRRKGIRLNDRGEGEGKVRGNEKRRRWKRIKWLG